MKQPIKPIEHHRPDIFRHSVYVAHISIYTRTVLFRVVERRFVCFCLSTIPHGCCYTFIVSYRFFLLAGFVVAAIFVCVLFCSCFTAQYLIANSEISLLLLAFRLTLPNFLYLQFGRKFRGCVFCSNKLRFYENRVEVFMQTIRLSRVSVNMPKPPSSLISVLFIFLTPLCH